MAKESPETYTLLLQSSTQSGNPYPLRPYPYSDLNNVTWSVNYDELFEGRQQLFEFCRVRFQLLCGSNLTLNTGQGYLSANFPTSFQNETGKGTVLGLIAPDDNPTGLGTTAAYFANGFNDIGIDINHSQLTGVQLLNIQWINSTGELISGPTSYYDLVLLFELYN